jgi:hypothetical protein
MIEEVQKRSDEECARLVTEQRSSGKTQKVWCEENGVKLRTFRNWIYKSNRNSLENTGTVGWISVLRDDSRSLTNSRQCPPLEVKIGRYIITVHPNFNKAAFLEVCRALDGIC